MATVSRNVATGLTGAVSVGYRVMGSRSRGVLQPRVGGSAAGFLVSGDANALFRNVVGPGGNLGILVTTTGTGNEIKGNTVQSGGLNLGDEHGDCASTTWLKNVFTTKFPDCIQ